MLFKMFPLQVCAEQTDSLCAEGECGHGCREFAHWAGTEGSQWTLGGLCGPTHHNSLSLPFQGFASSFPRSCWSTFPPKVRVSFTELCKRLGQVITKVWPGCITLVLLRQCCWSCTISPCIFFCGFHPVSCLHSQPDVIFFRLLPEARKWKPPILPRVSETSQSFTMETKLGPKASKSTCCVCP